MAFVIVITIVLGNSVFVNAKEAKPYAACSHTWSSWQINETSYKLPPVFGDCKIRVSKWVRACTKCGEIEYKYTEYQMTHDWADLGGGKKNCRNCNMTISQARQTALTLY